MYITCIYINMGQNAADAVKSVENLRDARPLQEAVLSQILI